MADKKKLTNSFGTSRRKKPSLDEINKIAEGASTASPTPPAPATPPKSPKAVAKPKPKARKPSPPVPPKPAPPLAPVDIPMKKTSVDLPLELYQDLKIHLIKNQMKFREYLTNLIEADLKKNRK